MRLSVRRTKTVRRWSSTVAASPQCRLCTAFGSRALSPSMAKTVCRWSSRRRRLLPTGPCFCCGSTMPARRRSNPHVLTVFGKCGHLCGSRPRFLDMVVCDYCTRDAVAKDPYHDEVWVEIRRGQSPVLRKLPKPRPDNGRHQKETLFEV